MKKVEVAATRELEANEAETKTFEQKEAKLEERLNFLSKEGGNLRYEIESYFKIIQTATLGKTETANSKY